MFLFLISKYLNFVRFNIKIILLNDRKIYIMVKSWYFFRFDLFLNDKFVRYFKYFIMVDVESLVLMGR